MVEKFYVLLLEDGRRVIVACRPNEIDGRLSELKAFLLGEGNNREEALTRAEQANPKPGWYSGSGPLPMPK